MGSGATKQDGGNFLHSWWKIAILPLIVALHRVLIVATSWTYTKGFFVEADAKTIQQTSSSFMVWVHCVRMHICIHVYMFIYIKYKLTLRTCTKRFFAKRVKKRTTVCLYSETGCPFINFVQVHRHFIFNVSQSEDILTFSSDWKFSPYRKKNLIDSSN